MLSMVVTLSVVVITSQRLYISLGSPLRPGLGPFLGGSRLVICRSFQGCKHSLNSFCTEFNPKRAFQGKGGFDHHPSDGDVNTSSGHEDGITIKGWAALAGSCILPSG